MTSQDWFEGLQVVDKATGDLPKPGGTVIDVGGVRSFCATLGLCWIVSNTSISQDTSLHVHTLMVTRFASMTVEERAKAFEELNETAPRWP